MFRLGIAFAGGTRYSPSMPIEPAALDELFDSVSFGAPENAVGFVLWRVLHRFVREVDRALEVLSLTHLQFTTLTLIAWMSRSGEAVEQAMLARSGDMHPMQVSQMLKALEGKGMVVRAPSTSKRSAKRVEITPAGLTALRAALPVMIKLQQQLFGEEGGPGGSLLVALRRVEQR